MVRICISVPDELAAQLKAADFNVSGVCQRALAERLGMPGRPHLDPVEQAACAYGGAILHDAHSRSDCVLVERRS